MKTDLREKERVAIERLKAFEPEDGYFLAYSGGKDSDCIKILAHLAGAKFEAVHNLTTVDAPETVQYATALLSHHHCREQHRKHLLRGASEGTGHHRRQENRPDLLPCHLRCRDG